MYIILFRLPSKSKKQFGEKWETQKFNKIWFSLLKTISNFIHFVSCSHFSPNCFCPLTCENFFYFVWILRKSCNFAHFQTTQFQHILFGVATFWIKVVKMSKQVRLLLRFHFKGKENVKEACAFQNRLNNSIKLNVRFRMAFRSSSLPFGKESCFPILSLKTGHTQRFQLPDRFLLLAVDKWRTVWILISLRLSSNCPEN